MPALRFLPAIALALLLVPTAHAGQDRPTKPPPLGRIVSVSERVAGSYFTRTAWNVPDGSDVGAGDLIYGEDTLNLYRLLVVIEVCKERRTLDARTRNLREHMRASCDESRDRHPGNGSESGAGQAWLPPPSYGTYAAALSTGSSAGAAASGTMSGAMIATNGAAAPGGRPLSADDLNGRTVVGSDGKAIGTVANVVSGRRDLKPYLVVASRQPAAVEQRLAVPWDEVVGYGDRSVLVRLSERMLQGIPAYVESLYTRYLGPAGPAAPTATGTAGASSGGTAPTAPAAAK